MSDAKMIEDVLNREYRAIFARSDFHAVKSYLNMLTKVYNINRKVLQRITLEKMRDEVKQRGG